MTDKELIQALRDEDITDVRDMMDYMETAADRLEALLAENERLKAGKDTDAPTKWVSVEERLPGKEGRYLCVKRIGTSGMCYVTIMNGDKYGFNMEHIYSDDVTHWQPIPEPPSTEGVE